jgi:hypothetical protein
MTTEFLTGNMYLVLRKKNQNGSKFYPTYCFTVSDCFTRKEKIALFYITKSPDLTEDESFDVEYQ